MDTKSMDSLNGEMRWLEDNFRALVENAPDMITILRDGRFAYTNPATSEILGYRPEELSQMRFLDVVAPADREAASRICALPLSQEQARRFEMDLVRKDGRQVPLEIRPLALSLDGPPAVQLTCRDMTEQKRLTQHLVQSEKMAALARFISAVAHELNNPLTVIAGFAEILLSELKLNEQDRADLKMVVDEAKRARLMVHHLLSLSRDYPPRPRVVDVNQLLTSSLARHRAGLEASQVRVVTQLAGEPPRVSIDPDHLRSVIDHLVKYLGDSLTSASRGGTLLVKTSIKQSGLEPQVSQVVEICLADDGPGRTETEASQVFEPRFTAKEDDWGLGLALSYRFIEANGGRLYALSQPPGGMQLIVELPQTES